MSSLSLSDLPPLPSPAGTSLYSLNIINSERIEATETDVNTRHTTINAIEEAHANHPSQEQLLPPVDGGYGAWSFLGSAFLVETLVWGLPNSFGVFLSAYSKDPRFSLQPNSESLLPLIGNLSSGIIYCSGPVIYYICARFPSTKRAALWLGLVLCFLGVFCASFATKIWHLVLLQGAVYGIGGSLLYALSISFMTEWFVRRRGLANGIIFAGTAMGGLILPILLPPLFKKVGISLSLRIIAIIMLMVLSCALPFVRGRIPTPKVSRPLPRRSHHRWLWTGSLRLVLLINTIQGFAYFVPLTWLPSFAEALPISSSGTSLPLAFLNGCSVMSRIGMGFLSDKISPWLLGFVTLAMASSSTFLLWGVAADSLASLVAYGVVYGTVAGGWSSMWTAFMRPVTDDPATSTTIFGLMMLSRGIGNILSTPISSSLIRSHPLSPMGHTGFAVGDGKYENMIIYVGTCFAGASALALFGWLQDRKGNI